MTKMEDKRIEIYSALANDRPVSELPIACRVYMIHDALLLWQKRNTLQTFQCWWVSPMAEIIRTRVESGIVDLGIAIFQYEMNTASISKEVMEQCNDLFEALYEMNFFDLSMDYLAFHNVYGVMKNSSNKARTRRSD